MLTELKIAQNPQREAALDHASLYQLGLERIQSLSKSLWTDFNVHDPGVTTLEILCYALTDLSYRASMPVADLLAGKENNAANMRRQFFSARQILPNRPLTVNDYRKLLIDLKGVKNAWIQPATHTLYAHTYRKQLMPRDNGEPGVVAVDIGGLYNVLIDFMDDLKAAEKKQVLSDVQDVLHANRNLCEDFVSIKEVKSQDFILCGEFELARNADSAIVKSQILFQVQQFLAPAVANYSLGEMLEKTKPNGEKYHSDDLFNGPALSCGFIPDDELETGDLRQQVRLSDLINIIMDIEGVVAISDILLNPLGRSKPLDNKWVVDVEAGEKINLSMDQSRLVLRKNGMPLVPAQAEVDASIAALQQAARSKLETEQLDDLDIPSGRYRSPQNYHAFQNHFPAVYGLSDVGLTANADEKRKAQALQFKGYLLFFEQLLADYLAQLAHVRELFSTDPSLTRTYFYQLVESFRDHQAVYADGFSPQDFIEQIEDPSVLIDRRNRFLDHLIARFAEQFSRFADVMYSAFDSNPETLVRYKCDFLNSYPQISSDRGLAYNYSLPELTDIWNSNNISGLEKRLAKLLGIGNSQRRNLSDVSFDLYTEIDATPGDEFRFRIRNRDDGSILLSSSKNYETQNDARIEMRIAILAGQEDSGYSRRRTSGGKFYFNVVDGSDEIVARRIEYFGSEAEMEQAIEVVKHYLRINYSEEGMYLIENILLLPEQANDPFLPICVEGEDVENLDPYSYRVHIALPAYGTRFIHMEFRRYAEKLIRDETPAHILPKVCWIDKDDMAQLERAYLEWMKLKHGRSRAQREQKMRRFIKVLYTVKNVYPTERIYECEAQEQKSKFVIGRKSLGSFE
jgi:hypothetical protein